MFGASAMDVDFAAAWTLISSREPSSWRGLLCQPESCVPLPQFGDVSEPLGDSLRMLSNAWGDLQALRRLSLSSISVRAPAVTLMAMEAVLWARLESLAAFFSPKIRASTSDSIDGLSTISGYLWGMVEARSSTREVDITAIVSSSDTPTSSWRSHQLGQLIRTSTDKDKCTQAY